jgi:ADP-ribose pyrophosphatase YjhB (NUDIX family)
MSRSDYFDDPEAPLPNSIVPAVTAVVLDEDAKVLLILRSDSDRWALPGGGQDLGENLASAVVREVEEETGIEVEVTGIVGTYSDPRHVIAYDDGEVRQEFSICFRARPTGGQLRDSSESREVRWVSAHELEQLDIHPSMLLRIGHGMDGSRTEPHIG